MWTNFPAACREAKNPAAAALFALSICWQAALYAPEKKLAEVSSIEADALFIERCDRLLPGGWRAFFPDGAPLYRGLTVNGLRLNPQRFAGCAPFAVRPSPFAPGNFYLLDADARVGLHPYHHAGVYYAQEPSASAPAALLGVRPGDWVLDLCAAPGGKSAQLAAALAGSGLLVANEFSPKRAPVLLSNLERMGARNCIVTNETAERLARAFPAAFDRILVDAPCSGEGMFRKEPAALAQHSQRLIESCAALQRELLDTVAAALRPGGTLVYSTCTFSPEEDEGTVAVFLRRHPEFALEQIDADFGCAGHEACCAQGPVDTGRLRCVYPVHGGEGQFMARFCKAGEAPRAAVRGSLCAGAAPREARDFLAECFPALADAPLARQGDRLLLLPQPELPLPPGLRVLRAGVLAGELAAGGRTASFEPHHHLYMAWGADAPRRLSLSPDEERCAAWLRGEEIAALGMENGFAAVTVDGFPLGFGKVSGGRLKNHYPKGLRNLK